MAEKVGSVLILEPYYDGSHRAFADGLATHLKAECTLLTLPGRKWKQRVRTAALTFAPQIASLLDAGQTFDALICGSMLNLAELKGVEPRLSTIPSMVYFHENQLAYPARSAPDHDAESAAAGMHSALAADLVAFNSQYNLKTMLVGMETISGKLADMAIHKAAGLIEQKSIVLWPPIQEPTPESQTRPERQGPPVILWNHRWEHDKDPESFFRTMTDLDNAGYDFRLAVVGQSFPRSPEIFGQAHDRLAHRLVTWGFQRSCAQYSRVLAASDIVVSTAKHEFYGLSVMEAMAAGVRPLVPDRLVYPELYPRDFRYSSRSDLLRRLKKLLKNGVDEDGWNRRKLSDLAAPHTWARLAPQYNKIIKDLVDDS